MRLIAVSFLLALSPLCASAGSLVEGEGGAQPVVRIAPVVKNPAIAAPGTFDVKEVKVPRTAAGTSIQTLRPEIQNGAAVPQLAPSAPGGEAVLPQSDAVQPRGEKTQVLPGLEAVGETLERSRTQSPAGAEAAQERELNFAYDKWADEGGGPALAVSVGGEAHGHQSLAAHAASEKHAPPVPPAPKTPLWRRFIPNALTTGNLWSGTAAAYFASQGMVKPAVAAIIAAVVFDMHDGMAARALKVKNPLGIDYDSLADVVSFGVAPALLIFKAALLPALGIWGFPIAALFATAGWFRLSRFNVSAHAEEGGSAQHKKSDSFTGLPIPGGAGVIAAIALLLGVLPAAFVAPVAIAGTLLTAAAMASRLPYPAFKAGGLKARLIPAVVGLAAAAPLAAMGLWAWIPALLFGMYLATGPLVWLWKGGSDIWKRELKRKGFHQMLLLTIPGFYLVGAANAALAAVGFVGVIGLIEQLRLRVPATAPFFEKFFGGIIRGKESGRMSGSFYAALGLGAVAAAVSLLHLSPLIFVGAALALTLGDAASPLVGMRFGWKPYKVKGTQRSVDGTVAGFAVALTIGLALGFPWFAALGAALAFSAVDTYPVKPDDNLWIPISFAAVLSLLTLL